MKRVYTVTVVFLLLLCSQSFSQFHLKLGPQVGMNFNLHTGSDLPETGSGVGVVFGGTVDMDFSPMIGLQTNLQFYDNRSGSTTTESSQEVAQGVSATISRETSASLAYFIIEPLFKLSIPNSGFYFFAGPSVGFNIEGSFEAEGTATLPDGYTWQSTGTNKMDLAKSKGTLKDLLVRFELKLGSGYDIPVSRLITITPQVSFGFGLTKVQSDLSSRILTIQALCGLKFALL